jgi:lysozyme
MEQSPFKIKFESMTHLMTFEKFNVGRLSNFSEEDLSELESDFSFISDTYGLIQISEDDESDAIDSGKSFYYIDSARNSYIEIFYFGVDESEFIMDVQSFVKRVKSSFGWEIVNSWIYKDYGFMSNHSENENGDEYVRLTLVFHKPLKEGMINEEFKMDIKSYLTKIFQKIKNFSFEKKKSLLTYGLTSLLTFANINDVNNIINTDNFIKSEISATPGLRNIIDSFSPFKDVSTLKLSNEGWKQIKLEEGDPKNPGAPVLTAYKLGDGKITIGWGHAEPIKNSKYNVGDKITREEAKELLKKDLKVAADGVRRIFKEWKDNGIDRKITQSQFDALVSMAFNLGVSGLRRTEVMKLIKKGKYQKAGEVIKRGGNSKFSGLKSRRERESKMFLSGLNQSDNNLDKL